MGQSAELSIKTEAYVTKEVLRLVAGKSAPLESPQNPTPGRGGLHGQSGKQLPAEKRPIVKQDVGAEKEHNKRLRVQANPKPECHVLPERKESL